MALFTVSRRLEYLTESKIPAVTTSKKPAMIHIAPTNWNALAEIARKTNTHASHPNADKATLPPHLPQAHRLLHRGCSATMLTATAKKRKSRPIIAQSLGSRQLISSTIQIIGPGLCHDAGHIQHFPAAHTDLSANGLNPAVQKNNQNAPQNQIESKPAIAVDAVGSEAVRA